MEKSGPTPQEPAQVLAPAAAVAEQANRTFTITTEQLQAFLALAQHHQKRKTPIPIAPTYAVVAETADKYELSRDRFAYTLLYLTGQRVTEALQLTRADLEPVISEGKKFLLVHSITLKNRTAPRRDIPVPWFGVEAPLVDYIWAMVNDLRPEVRLFIASRGAVFQRLRKVTIHLKVIDPNTRMAHEAEVPVHPHLLRHFRASHLVDLYGFEKGRLERYFGWASDKMANVYVSVNWRELAKAFG